MDHLRVFYAQFFKTVKYSLYLFLIQFSRVHKTITGAFFACHLRNLYFQNFLSWNEIIHILSSTSLLTENKGALVSKCRVQRSICFLYYYNKFVSTYLEYIHSVSRTIASALVLSIGLGYVLGSRPASLLHIDIRVIYSWGSFQNSTS